MAQPVVPSETSSTSDNYQRLKNVLALVALYFVWGRTVSPVFATSYAYINSIVAVLLGVLFLDETISLRALVAMAIILTGVMCVVFGRSLKRGHSSKPKS